MEEAGGKSVSWMVSKVSSSSPPSERSSWSRTQAALVLGVSSPSAAASSAAGSTLCCRAWRAMDG